MVGMHATGTAVLTDDKFLGGVGLVAFGDVVEMPTFGAF